MLNPQDRNAIEGLFDRLAEIEQQTPPRDAEAEALIRLRVREQPGVAYYMAQTILVQEAALAQARERIAELERRAERRDGGSLFGGLFGDDRDRYGRDRADRAPVRRERGPWDRQDEDRRDGGGFLAGAAQTALGVTGGILLGQAIGSIFSAGGAHAAEAPQDRGADQADADTDMDAGGGFDDFGGFDMGGDF